VELILSRNRHICNEAIPNDALGFGVFVFFNALQNYFTDTLDRPLGFWLSDS
jgi:hypothetical protein